jgi:hypothetical protein
MNYTLIILGVILVVIIYMVYQVTSTQGKISANIITLKNGISNPAVLYSALATNTSDRYFFSFWVNVDNLSKGSSNTRLFSVLPSSSSTPSSSTPSSTLTIYLKNDATLAYHLWDDTKEHVMMQNFPLQKWVYVVLSVDNNIVDTYIDGKLTRSETVTGSKISTTKDSIIDFGVQRYGSVVYLAKMERMPSPMDPTMAWSKYMSGNGGNSFSNLLSSYGANLTLSKDNLEINNVTLF